MQAHKQPPEEGTTWFTSSAAKNRPPRSEAGLATLNLCDLSALTQVIVTASQVVVSSMAAAAHSDVSREKSREVFEVRAVEVSGPSSGHSVGSWEEEMEQEVGEGLLFSSRPAGGANDTKAQTQTMELFVSLIFNQKEICLSQKKRLPKTFPIKENSVWIQKYSWDWKNAYFNQKC